MAQDYYADAQQIIEALLAEGLIAEANGLRKEIEAGCTGTEILMGMLWQLQNIYRATKPLSGTKQKIRTLIADLKRALRQ